MMPDDMYDGRAKTITGPLFEASPALFLQSKPTPAETLVAGLIWKHRGRNNSIALARIQELTGFSVRHIKDIVEQLVVTHKLQIGGRRDDPVGYFMIQDADDQATAVGPYKSQILAMFKRLRVLEAPHRLREFLGQLKLEV